jgi:hypothetical protein
METLVELAPGQAPVVMSLDDLRAGILGGRMNPWGRVSFDRGASWHPAWRAAGLPPPQQPQDDAAMRMILPVGRSGWAIAAGYVAILTLVADLGYLPVALLVPAKDVGGVAASGAIAFVFVGIPPLVLALVAHRAIKRDPSKHGMGRVGFAYVCAGLLLFAVLAAAIRAAVG